MYWDDERAAFTTRVQDNFDETLAKVQYPGRGAKPPSDGYWVRMSLLPSISKRITLGPNAIYREYGTLLFQIFGPGTEGATRQAQIADELSALFNEAIFSYQNSGNIRCQVPVLQTRGATPDNQWFQLNLLVDYQRDITLA